MAIKMKERTLVPGEIIFKKGDFYNRLYFVHKGSVEIYVEIG